MISWATLSRCTSMPESRGLPACACASDAPPESRREPRRLAQDALRSLVWGEVARRRRLMAGASVDAITPFVPGSIWAKIKAGDAAWVVSASRLCKVTLLFLRFEAVLDDVYYGQLPVPSLGGGVGYGATAIECWTVGRAAVPEGVDVPVSADGVAPWTH